MKVLLVKLSSMGDLIHALPAITDAQSAIPGIEFDWVIDEHFSEVATWHQSVNHVIKSAHRRWRSQIIKSLFGGDIVRFCRALRKRDYDVVLDAQCNFKSAIITRLARGRRAGLDKASAAESIAALAYQDHYNVKKGAHAVDRLRLLFSKALGYTLPTSAPDFAISLDKLVPVSIDLPTPYLVFIHNASWQSKWWPENYWLDLIKRAKQANMHVLIPWGNALEKARAQRLSQDQDNVVLLPQITLSQAAYLIKGAKAAVCVDTGLGHLTAALNVPSVSLYGPTDPGLIGATGGSQIHLHADFPCAPCYHKTCIYTEPSAEKPACFMQLPPALVWKQLMGLLEK